MECWHWLSPQFWNFLFSFFRVNFRFGFRLANVCQKLKPENKCIAAYIMFTLHIFNMVAFEKLRRISG